MDEKQKSIINLNEIYQDVKSDLIGKLLNETEDNKKCMWYLICALDGMDENEIIELAGYTIPQIQDARSDFLMKKYQGSNPLFHDVQNLKNEVKEIVQENREVRSSIEAGLDQAIREQIEKSNKLIEAKDDMIEMLKLQKIELQRKIENLQSQINNLQSQQKERADVVVPKESEKTEVIMQPEEEKRRGIGERIRKYFFSVVDTKKFIEKYLSSNKLSDEQKEYLLNCLESGMSMKEMEGFVSENLSVDYMKRLNKIMKNRK